MTMDRFNKYAVLFFLIKFWYESQHVTGTAYNSSTVPWRFTVISDLHLAEKYVFRTNVAQEGNDRNVAKFVYQSYGGEFLLMPGDTNAGHWDSEDYRKKMSTSVGYNVTSEQAVLIAGDRCYGGILAALKSGGYTRILMTVGDHEVGDNPWNKGSSVSHLLPTFKQAFSKNFNTALNGTYLYKASIGAAPARPIGTKFENTSYAYRHRNVLIVSVDVFYQKSPFIEIGDAGTVAGIVQEDHLAWLDFVLSEGRKDTTIKHIFVTGHFPVMYPVRKVRSSGQMMVNETKSGFWNLLRKHDVDIYFCGEVHLTTVSKDPNSNLLQIAARGNFFSELLTVDVTDDSIIIKTYHEYGEKLFMYNYQYIPSGNLTIVKSSGNKTISGSGYLSPIDRLKPMLYYSFEELYPMRNRSFIGNEMWSEAPTKVSVVIDGITCDKALPNTGEFGQYYDAQTNIMLVPGKYGNAGSFNSKTRAAVSAAGPHAYGYIVSYALWLKTTSNTTDVLISLEGYWNKPTALNLLLDNGIVSVAYSQDQKLVDSASRKLNDGLWHHVALTMPKESCLVSEIVVFIDGTKTKVTLIGSDSIMTFPNSGMVALGGFGYGGEGANTSSRRRLTSTLDNRPGFLNGSSYKGLLDEVYVFARTLSSAEISLLSGRTASPVSPTFAPSNKAPVVSPSSAPTPKRLIYNIKTKAPAGQSLCISVVPTANLISVNLMLCNASSIRQRFIMDSPVGIIKSVAYPNMCISPQNSSTTPSAKLLLDTCNKNYKWNVMQNRIATVANSTLAMAIMGGNAKKGNSIVLQSYIGWLYQKWDMISVL